MRKWEAVATLDTVMKDCKTHSEWDTKDEHNWESMADLLKSVRDYIIRNQS